MIDDEWCRFFKNNGVLVGLSLDGDASLHNQNRIDTKGKGTYGRVMSAKQLLDRHNVPYNILCVLTAEAARRARRIWGFIVKAGIRHIQFIPCLASLDGLHHDNGKADATALDSKRFCQFYSVLFPLWKAEADRGNMVNVRLFEDLAGLHLTGQSITCGMSGRCTPQIVVEADGSVYPCDFYVLDEYRVANLSESSLREVFDAVVNSGFLNKPDTPKWCEDCPYTAWCHGGCKRMEKAVYGRDCGMRLFLDRHLTELIGYFRGKVGKI